MKRPDIERIKRMSIDMNARLDFDTEQGIRELIKYIERLENALCNAFINEEGFATCDQDCDVGECLIDCKYLRLVEIVKEIIERGQSND